MSEKTNNLDPVIAWEEFAPHAMPADADASQRAEMRLAFVAGWFDALAHLAEAAPDPGSGEKMVETFVEMVKIADPAMEHEQALLKERANAPKPEATKPVPLYPYQLRVLLAQNVAANLGNPRNVESAKLLDKLAAACLAEEEIHLGLAVATLHSLRVQNLHPEALQLLMQLSLSQPIPKVDSNRN